MARTFDLIIKGGTCVTADKAGEADIGISSGKIAAIGDLSQADAGEVITARGLHVLPGVIDSQVHLREPGAEHKEDLHTGSRAAVAGGVTAVFEMPNTKPPTTGEEELADKLARAEGRMYCDHAFYIGASAGNADRLRDLERLPGAAGVKVFVGSSTGNLLVADDATLERVLASGTRRAAIHSEDETRLNERKPLALEGQVDTHPVWRDAETAIRATRRVIAIARRVGRPVHILHVTTAEEMEFLSGHKDIASVEVTPQHLTLAAPDCYRDLGTFAQMNPPIRDARHRDALWRGVTEGVVDVVGSDHAPHTKEEKAAVYPATPSGMPGVQTLLPLLLDHAYHRRLTLARVVDLTSGNARKIFRLRDKGALEIGLDADLTLVDLQGIQQVSADWLQSKCGWSPFEGRELHGRPMGTIVRGVPAMRDGEVVGEPQGRPIAFNLD